MIYKKVDESTSCVILENPTEVMSKKYDNINLITDSNYAGNLDQISDDEWAFGDFGAKETWKMLINGDINETIKKKYEKYKTKEKPVTILSSVKRRRKKNEFDGDICIDSFLSGDSSYFRKTNKVNSKSKGIRLIINIGYNCGNESEKLFENVSKALNKLELVVKLGYRLEVYAASLSTNVGRDEFKNLISMIILKESYQPIDMVRLKTVTLPGFFRSAIFRAENIINHQYDAEISSGLGQPINTQQNFNLLKSILKKTKFVLGDEKIIYYDGATDKGIEGIQID